MRGGPSDQAAGAQATRRRVVFTSARTMWRTAQSTRALFRDAFTLPGIYRRIYVRVRLCHTPASRRTPRCVLAWS